MAYLCKLPTEDAKDYVDDGSGRMKGECVSLVKRMCRTVPVTSQWKMGDLIKGNTALAEGTAIASFDPTTKHYWHAAIYVRQDATGIRVWDQYCRGATAHPPKLNRLVWVSAKSHVAGDNFHVID